MRNSLILFAFVVILAGCGGDNDDPAPQASTPAAEEERTEDGKVHEPDLAGASEGVKKYYGDAHVDQGGDESADVEAEYHQPPQPPVVGLGETITLTGSNIGIRQEVTLDRVKRAGNRTEVTLSLENTGIAVYEAPLQNASLTYAGGKTVPVGSEEVVQRRPRPGLSAHGRGPGRGDLPGVRDRRRQGSGGVRAGARAGPDRSRRDLEPALAALGHPDRLDDDRGIGKIRARVGDDRADLLHHRLAAGDLAE